MEVRAIAKDTGVPPRKARLLIDMVRGRKVEEALNLGLLINSPRKNTLRFMPALTVTREEVDRMIDILKGALQKVGEKP